MNGKLLSRLAMIVGLIGLAIFLTVILSGTAYPHPFFQIGVCAGLVCVSLCIVLEVIAWCWEVYHGLRQKQYLWVVVLIVLLLITVGSFVITSLW